MLILLVLLAPSIAAAQCAPGRRMLLLASSYNPDVLLWDSRQRLLDYAAGDWNVKRLLLPHALLARAGTVALIVTCQYNIVHPRYRFAPADAAGVKVASGPYKGRYGWMMAEDLRRLTRAK
ncbi:MAG: hypothetical protein NVS9B12_00550 [Vulcanimicrobiaceae bacterium]